MQRRFVNGVGGFGEIFRQLLVLFEVGDAREAGVRLAGWETYEAPFMHAWSPHEIRLKEGS